MHIKAEYAQRVIAVFSKVPHVQQDYARMNNAADQFKLDRYDNVDKNSVNQNMHNKR